MTGTGFDSTKTQLEELLTNADRGKLQLPDFQRGWVWDDERIKSLIASVSVSFPVGAVMMLETGGEHIRFKPRPLDGTAAPIREVVPETLILDGQQRLTSLYRALMSQQAVDTKDSKGKRIRRWYYIDMKKAIDPQVEQEDAILSVPEDRLLREFGGSISLDLSAPEYEFANDLFPFNRVFQVSAWRRAYNKHWNHNEEKSCLFDEFEETVLARVSGYLLPVITLKKETPKEAVCLVFERVNTGGVDLTVFELLTASFAADDFQLRDDWALRDKRMKSNHPVLANLKSDDFLQVVSLLVTQARQRQALADGVAAEKAPGISCKRKDLLKLEVADWEAWADEAEYGFEKAARFLHGQKVFKAGDLPYRTQLIPLAAILADLLREGENEGVLRKIARWYWCGVLGELYGSATESRFARDLPEVIAFVRGDSSEPDTITESNFQPGRLLTLRTRNSAAYKGLYALLMRDGGCDFRTGERIEAQVFFDDNIDIHHIFPEDWCKSVGIPSTTYNSVINKTAISARTNRQIGGRAPSDYLPKLERKASINPDRMDDMLATHLIEPSHLRTDDFWNFFSTRAEMLLQRIESVTDKKIAREIELFQPETTTKEMG